MTYLICYTVFPGDVGYDVSHVLVVYPGNGIIYRLRADIVISKHMTCHIYLISYCFPGDVY